MSVFLLESWTSLWHCYYYYWFLMWVCVCVDSVTNTGRLEKSQDKPAGEFITAFILKIWSRLRNWKWKTFCFLLLLLSPPAESPQENKCRISSLHQASFSTPSPSSSSFFPSPSSSSSSSPLWPVKGTVVLLLFCVGCRTSCLCTIGWLCSPAASSVTFLMTS